MEVDRRIVVDRDGIGHVGVLRIHEGNLADGPLDVVPFPHMALSLCSLPERRPEILAALDHEHIPAVITKGKVTGEDRNDLVSGSLGILRRLSENDVGANRTRAPPSTVTLRGSTSGWSSAPCHW
jgi:hypothetical protein